VGLGTRPRRTGATLVEGNVAEQAEKPRARRAAPDVVGVGAVPDAEECLLHSILGCIGVVGDAQRETIGERCEAVVQHGERGLVTASDAREERRLDVRCGRHSRPADRHCCA
jgi:hypothetical protein